MQEADDYMRQRILDHARFYREHIRFFWPILVICILFCLVYYLISKPSYTATAVIGSPNPSPTVGMISNATGVTISASSAAKRILGGGASGGGNDPFQEFLQLLTSPRLAAELSDRGQLLPIVFDKQWDSEKNAWKPNDPLFYLIADIKRSLNRPVSDHPDAEALGKFLETSLKVEQASSYSASFLTTSGYMTVSLKLHDRDQAQAALMLLLKGADDLIRRDMLHEVNARIDYINREMPTITAAEQRNTLIQVLTSQEELKTMLEADKFYSILIVTPPHAPTLPTSPPSPRKALLMTFIASLVLWVIVLELSRRIYWLRRVTDWFRRGC